MTKIFPWAELMHKGLGILHLSPSEFWRSTPREIAAAFWSLSQPANADGLRQSLEDLMQRFPDQ